ncbi:MAG: cytochrome C oxidase Cbb3 [Alphaproteobacteria bacterium]|nr:cytochrome C oxidase Cbb3 [Alphaproteobacteria bacterium]
MRRCISLLIALLAPAALAAPDVDRLYIEHCAACHGTDRLGGLGPALLPENLSRLRPAHAESVIAKGRPATQMIGFSDKLSAEDIAALAKLIYQPPPVAPVWNLAEIEASRIIHAAADPAAKPVHGADPLNLFVVVESGDHHVTILDGDRFEPLHRFPSRFALHGGPKFTPDGRYVYFGSRDGWISKYDLHTLTLLSEIRAGINTRNIALSSDGRFVAVANYLPHSLVLLDAADLKPLRLIEARDIRGRQSSRVSAVYQAPNRKSFIVALKDIPEIWEIATDEAAGPVYTGLVHSHEKGMTEALAASAGLFAHRRIAVETLLDDFMFDPDYRHLLGSSRDGAGATVVNLNVGRPIASVALDGLPHLGSGISFLREGRRLIATPHLNRAQISVIDTADWSVFARIPTGGPGFFMRSHENTPYAWTDAMLGPGRDTMTVIDKRSLAVAGRITPTPGKTAAHVEFDRHGRHALVSVWEMDGALVVYDADALREVKRLPMVKPSGKYNVYNKITFSEGTSH